jgi:hypothetical protein
MVKDTLNKTLTLNKEFVLETEDYCNGTARNFSKLVELAIKEFKKNNP